MDVNAAVSALTNSDPTDAAASIKARLQVGLLRKSLDAQENESQALLQMLEGKGRNLDIRV